MDEIENSKYVWKIIDKYIATEFPEVDSNLYVFWEKNSKLFPNLSRVAKKTACNSSKLSRE